MFLGGGTKHVFFWWNQPVLGVEPAVLGVEPAFFFGWNQHVFGWNWHVLGGCTSMLA